MHVPLASQPASQGLACACCTCAVVCLYTYCRQCTCSIHVVVLHNYNFPWISHTMNTWQDPWKCIHGICKKGMESTCNMLTFHMDQDKRLTYEIVIGEIYRDPIWFSHRHLISVQSQSLFICNNPQTDSSLLRHVYDHVNWLLWHACNSISHIHMWHRFLLVYPI